MVDTMLRLSVNMIRFAPIGLDVMAASAAISSASADVVSLGRPIVRCMATFL